MPNNYCQIFKQKIEEIMGKIVKIKPKYFRRLLSKYKTTGDKNIEEKLDKINGILKEIEEFREKFIKRATKLIEEFIQRRDNVNDDVKIIFDEKDSKFIIERDLIFELPHLNDFPALIKEITGNFVIYIAETINLPGIEKVGGDLALEEAKTIDLPNLKEIGGDFYAPLAEIFNLPNIKRIGGDIVFKPYNPNLDFVSEQADELRAKGILKGKIVLIDDWGRVVGTL
jgi:hypothetical protein